VRAHPTRLAAFASVQPRAGHWAALEELHHARDGGLVGLGELSPHSQGYAVDDPVLGEILTLAADWRMPVNLHVTDPEGRDYPGRVATPLGDFVALARNFPTTRFILAHWGGLLPLHEPAAVGLDNVFYDTAASPVLYDETVWKRFLAVVPPERVLFGSDFPLNLFPRLDSAPDMARLIAEATRAGATDGVLHRNAERLLNR
jgi:uncharacterized protein